MPETQTTVPKTFADAEATLAASLPGYESRPQQQRLAQAVENLIGQGEPRTGLFEAGCGTGKSLGLMIPAILSGKRTIVATATIALMEQYANSDVPFLQEHLGVNFSWTLLKGRSNYFCFAKAAEADRMRHDWVSQVEQEVTPADHDGDKEHIAASFPQDEWYVVSSSSADCPGKKECPFGAICKSEAAKAIAKASDLVVTNTAMLMTDLVIRETTEGDVEMLGAYDVVIIDEAHEVEEWATGALSAQIKRSGIESALVKAENFVGEHQQQIDASTARTLLADFWFDMESELSLQGRNPDPQRLPRSWFLSRGERIADLVKALNEVASTVESTIIRFGDKAREQARQQRLAKQVRNAAQKVWNALAAEDADMVRWIEAETVRRGRETVTQVALRTAPVNVGPFLHANLWSRVPVALASATLSVGGDFAYVSKSLGIVDAETLNVGTPFDYTTQARLFIPTSSTPSPKDRSGWMSYTAVTTLGLIDAAGGGALLLFTSRTAMKAAHDALAYEIENRGHTVLMQNHSGTNKEIARRFAEDKTSVLFALKSFFTGVDFRGDTCRLVIIDKMPFSVPTDPIFAARCEAIKNRGGSDFSELSVPAMTLTLVQGFGRLIRSKTDKGVVAILDSRLSSTGYGKKIVRSLPSSPQISSVTEAAAFFQEA